MRRIGRSNNNRSNERNANTYSDDEPSIQGVGSLLGHDVTSLLDGESVILPSDDDMSSINTNFNYNSAGNENDNDDIRAVDHEHDDDSTTNGPWMLGAALPNVETKAANDNYSDNNNNNNNNDNNNSRGRPCLPLWLTNSPTWLKTAIAIATALLIGAIVLVAVAAILNNNDNAGATSRSAVSPTMPSPEPTLKPVMASSPAPSSAYPSSAPTKGSTSKKPTIAEDSEAPVASPASPVADTLKSSPPPLAATLESSPPSLGSSTKTVFYVTGGRAQGADLTDFETNLGKLPLDASFMVNLGDWNSPSATQCDEASFQTVDALFASSTVPVYFIPGDNEVCTLFRFCLLLLLDASHVFVLSTTTLVQRLP